MEWGLREEKKRSLGEEDSIFGLDLRCTSTCGSLDFESLVPFEKRRFHAPEFLVP